jgi:hypothetical protein
METIGTGQATPRRRFVKVTNVIMRSTGSTSSGIRQYRHFPTALSEAMTSSAVIRPVTRTGSFAA